MKHLTTYITLFSALLMANLCSSCSDNSIPGTDDNNAVQFSTTISSDNDWNPLSRTITELKTGFENGDAVSVFSYYLPGGVDNNGEADFMYNQQMTFNGTDWTYSPIKYWPNNQGDKLKFMAFYPYDATKVKHVGYVTAEDVAKYPGLKVGYPKMNVNSLWYKDVMATDFVTSTKLGVGEKVELEFKHIMAKLDLRVKLNDYKSINGEDPVAAPTVYIKNIKIIKEAIGGVFCGFDENNTPIWTDITYGTQWADNDYDYVIKAGETVPFDIETNAAFIPFTINEVYWDMLVYLGDDASGNPMYLETLTRDTYNTTYGSEEYSGYTKENYDANAGAAIFRIYLAKHLGGEGVYLKPGYITTITINLGIYGIDNVQASSRPIAKWKDTTTTPVTF